MIPKAFVYASIAWPNAATPEFLRSQALERAFSLAFLLAPPPRRPRFAETTLTLPRKPSTKLVLTVMRALFWEDDGLFMTCSCISGGNVLRGTLASLEYCFRL